MTTNHSPFLAANQNGTIFKNSHEIVVYLRPVQASLGIFDLLLFVGMILGGGYFSTVVQSWR